MNISKLINNNNNVFVIGKRESIPLCLIKQKIHFHSTLTLKIKKIQIKSLCKYLLSQLGNRHEQYLGKFSFFSYQHEYTICRHYSLLIQSFCLPYVVSLMRGIISDFGHLHFCFIQYFWQMSKMSEEEAVVDNNHGHFIISLSSHIEG